MKLPAQSPQEQADARQLLARILIVDDDVDFAESLSELLELHGYKTRTANTMREAFRQAGTFEPDMALLDIRLGADNGLDVLAKLRASYPDIDALMLTAHASLDTAVEAVRHGAYDYLRKPIDIGDLLLALERCLEKRGLERDKRVAEEAHAQSEARYRATFEHAAVGIAQLTVEGRFLQTNAKFCKILGYEHEELRNLTFADVTHPDDLGNSRASVKALLTGEAKDDVREKRYIRKDGATVWGNLTISLVRDEAGDPNHFIAVVEDITERKRAEAALQESERQIRSIVENVPGVVYRRLMRADGSVSFPYVGPQDESLTGLGAERVTRDANALLDRLHPEDRDAWFAAWKKSADKLEPFNREVRIERSPDEYRWLRVHGVPHRLDNGDTLWDAIGFDVTKEKQGSEVRDRAFAALENLSEGVALFGPDDRLIFANRRYIELNQEAGAFIEPGRTYEEILLENLRVGRLAEAVGREDDWRKERLLAHRNLPYKAERRAGDMWQEIREGPLPDGSVIVLLTDITERKKAEAEAAEAHHRLSDAIESISEGFVLYDADERLVLCNATYRAMCPQIADILKPGAKLEDVLRASYERGMFQKMDGSVDKWVRARLAHYRTSGGTIEQTLADGRQLLAMESRTSDGGSVGIRTDITELKQTERELREREERIRSILDNVADGVVTIDTKGKIESFNPAAERMFGYRADEIVGRAVSNLMTGADRRQHNKHVANYLNTGVGKIVGFGDRELTGRRKDGSTFPLSLSVGEMRLGDNPVFIGSLRDISARKQAEEAIKASELKAAEAHALLAEAIESSPDAIVVYDAGDRLVLCNKAFKTGNLSGLTDLIEPGVSFEELVRASIERGLAVVPDGDVESYVGARVEHHRAGKGNLEVELADDRWMLFRERRMPGGGIIGTRTDITETKRTENAIRESEERFRAVVDNSPMSFLLKDTEGRIQLANQTYLDWYGPTLAEMVGKTSHDLFSKEIADAFVAQDRAALETGVAVEREQEIAFKDGSMHSIVVTKFPVFDGNGQPIGVGGISWDVTEQKRAEKAIRETEDRFRAAVDHSPLAFVLKDVDGKIRLVNKSYLQWFGKTAEDVVGKFAHDIYDDKLAEALTAHDAEIVSQAKVIERQHDAVFSDGSVHLCIVTKFPVFDSNHEVLGIGSITTDVTEQRKIEGQLHQAQKMEAVGQLTGGVAHDFNNLLTVILGNLDLLSESVDGDAAARELIDAALRASERSADLTQQLLAFSRKQTLNPKQTDINERLPALIELMKRTLGENIAVETDLADGLPKAMVDESQLESAILNLAINARDAMPQGGRLTIRTDSASVPKTQSDSHENLLPGRYVTVSVTDNGTGMSKEVIQHAFEPFFTTKEVGEGSGLGLSMAYGFARQSGGDLEIRSKLGKGTTVLLYLPGATGESKSPDDSQHGPRALPCGKETVLVVEDEPQVQTFVVTVLNRLGYTVLEAANGSEAIAVFEKNSGIDLVLTDLILPGGMNGHEIAKQVRKRGAQTKVVYISGYSGGAIEAGDPSMFLKKPFGRKALAETVRKALDSTNA